MERISLKCACGSEATFESSMMSVVVDGSAQWQDRHLRCLKVVKPTLLSTPGPTQAAPPKPKGAS